MLIDGLAVNTYTEPVVSLDLEIVAAEENIKDIVKLAKENNLKVEDFEHSVNISSLDSDLRIQLHTDPRYQEFISDTEDKEVLGYRIKVARLEDVLQGKIWAYMDKNRRKSKRQKDLADIFRMIEKYPQLKSSLPNNIQEELEK